jgi:steroid delta-isomerase-like uncharacterized protein
MSGQGLDQEFLEEFAERWWAAWNSHDGSAVAELCTEDVVNSGPAVGRDIEGREQMATYVGMFVQAFSDMRFTVPEPPYASLTQAKAIVPWRFEATHDGEFAPMGMTATGARLEIDGVDHLWFRDGLVCRRSMVYDYAQVMRTLSEASRRSPGAA